MHRVLGPGLLESVYLECLRLELTNRNLRSAAQVAIPIAYKGLDLGVGYRVDLLVEDRLVVEVKSVERVIAVHKAQVLT
ncbi:MAG TPA: GxxExxY protein, partial [Vicinamibacterales bacterium]|nr:GxxExxY protein [Vicinamibacterales bacterium]